MPICNRSVYTLIHYIILGNFAIYTCTLYMYCRMFVKFPTEVYTCIYLQPM